ncbi:MAG: hypothetical protein DMD83_24375 [Candidatus Rokuibacteriota bacterium]|nr:MAG: hypothetical protein DMD83_24375 [Candidatus Rokubacteria bacterium]
MPDRAVVARGRVHVETVRADGDPHFTDETADQVKSVDGPEIVIVGLDEGDAPARRVAAQHGQSIVAPRVEEASVRADGQ